MPSRRILLAFSFGLAIPLADCARTTAQPTSKIEAVRPGLTAAQVRDLLGPPTNISRRIVLYRTHEQWHYLKSGLRLSFDHPRGSPAVLVRISARE